MRKGQPSGPPAPTPPKAAHGQADDAWTEDRGALWGRSRNPPEGSEATDGPRQEAEDSARVALATRYHHYEVASAAFQIGIVLASATVITGMMALTWVSGDAGSAGLGGHSRLHFVH